MKLKILILIFFQCIFIIYCNAQDITARLIVDNFENTYQGINDYQCRMFEWSVKGRDYEKRVINFYFKKPRKIRMDILEGNKAFDSGSVGIFTEGDKVIGKKGGILSFVVLNVDKKSPLATTIRGVTFEESDMQATVERLKSHLEKSAVTIETIPDNIYQLICMPSNPSENDGVTKDIVRINAGTFLPVSVDRFEGDRFVQHSEWSAYIINAGLPDELFHIFYNPEKLAELGISAIHEVPFEKEKK